MTAKDDHRRRRPTRDDRLARWVAVLGWALTVVAAIVTVVLAIANGLGVARLFAEFTAALVLSSVVSATVGALILLRRSRNVIGWLLWAGGSGAWTAALGQYARFSLITSPGAVPAAEFAAWLHLWIWIPGLVLLMVVVPLLFPDGRPPSPRWWAVAWVAGLAGATGIVFRALSPAADPGLPEVPNPYAVSGAEPVLPVLEIVWSAGVVIAIVGAVVSLLVRFRRASGTRRQQLKWVFYGAALLLLAEVVAPLAGLALLGRVEPLIIAVAEAIAAPWLAITIGIAILRHRLYDIDALISRSLVYLMLSAVVVGLYVLVVGYFGVALNLRGEPVSLLAAAIIAIIFAPLQTRLQRLVDRWVYGRRGDPYAVLAELGRRLESTIEPDAVLETVVHTVRDALKLPRAEIVLGEDGYRVASGEPAGEGLELPLMFGRERVGVLVLSPRSPGEEFTLTDRRLLDDFARQAAVAAHAVSLATDLRRARTRLVTTREEERRRLRRDLHDGLGPELASQTLALDAARRLIDTDPAAAKDYLVELRDQIREAVTTIRRLVYDLRPPVLDDRGLAAAITEQTARFSHDGLRVELDLPDQLPTLPAAVDVAIYRIALEALTNVTRHADASWCELSLELEDGGLVLRVRDDGRGIPPDTPYGVGLTSMRERASELGGNISIESSELTFLTASIPLAEDTAWSRYES